MTTAKEEYEIRVLKKLPIIHPNPKYQRLIIPLILVAVFSLILCHLKNILAKLSSIKQNCF
jgi:hypothetical protein